MAFEAFPCHDFGDSGRWLIADVALRCDGDDHRAVVALAWATVLVYPVGLLLLTASLLGFHRNALLGHAPHTRLSAALRFTYGSYTADAFYWEIFEMGRRFTLVGIAVIFSPGTIVQLSSATTLCVMYMVIEHQTAPYTNPADNFIGLASSFGLAMLFFACVLLKLGVLLDNDEVRVRLSSEMLAVFDVPTAALSVVMFAAVVVTLVFAAFSISMQLRNELERALANLTTYYLLPTTYYLLLTSYYSLLTSY